MHGVITAFDSKKRIGHIQGEDGHIYTFSADDLQRAEEEDLLFADTDTDFEPRDSGAGGKSAKEVKVSFPEKASDKERRYSEPDGIPVFDEDIPDGFDILDRGLYRLERRDRTEEKALQRLRLDCAEVNANAAVRKEIRTELKSSFGYGFQSVVVSAVPVVLGRPDESGDCSADDLKNSLNQDKIKKLHSVLVNTRIGKMVVKFLALVLVAVFTAGFLISGGI